MVDESPIRQLQEANLESLSEIRDEVEALFSRYGTEQRYSAQTLKALFWYLSSRSQAVSFLISHGYSWDAEIILRSFYESAAKILFICFAEDDDKSTLVDEFWIQLSPIENRKMARKAAFAQDVFEKDSVSASVFAALQDGRLFDLDPDASRAHRRRLEQKWSFSEIIEYLDQRADKIQSLKGIKALLHVYGMASHLIHADQAAMVLMRDRATRELKEREIIEACHASRILSDQVSISWLCADALRLHFVGEFLDAKRMAGSLVRTMRAAEPFESAFSESQREFYAVWREKLE